MCERWTAVRHAQITQLCANPGRSCRASATTQIGGSARGYQAIVVPLAALSSPGYSPVGGQPAVYLYIAALEANCPLLPLIDHGGECSVVELEA